ncbi:MAG: hypothetical protein ACRESE_02070, partial [Gammaproteobacteria bacterium]
MRRHSGTTAIIQRVTHGNARVPSRAVTTSIGLLLALCVFTPHTVHAADPPAQATSQFDIGLGVGGVRFPYYPGAAEQRTLLLPFPYVIYHSRYLDVNRD